MCYMVEPPCYRKDEGSIPEKIIGFFFYLPNFSSQAMALESIHPFNRLGTRNFPPGKGPPARKADKLTAICEPTV
jgi:hypothetical protein